MDSNASQTSPDEARDATTSPHPGPSLALPAGGMLSATLAATLIFAAGSWLVLRAVRPAAAWHGPIVALGLGLIFAGSLLILRPWKRRPLARWPALWLAGRLACFVGVLVFAAALLYSAPQSDRLVVGLLILAGYAALYAAESFAAARALARFGASPSG